MLILFLPVFSLAGTVDLPQTGQMICYDADGNVIPCANTGEDGEIQAGVEWPSPRFTDNGDGTVTDNLTGLMWLQDANCISTRYPAFDNDGIYHGDGKVTWKNAFIFVAGINDGTRADCDGGYTDWRLPNVNELESLFNAEEADLATWLNGQGFINVQVNFYWSSTSYAGDTKRAWGAFMNPGALSSFTKTSDFFVWPVRGSTVLPAQLWETGQTTCYDASGSPIDCTNTGQDGEIQAGVEWPAPRFTDNLDGTVMDELTGLIWLKDATCFGKQSWQNALNTVANFNTDPGVYSCTGYTANYTGWRLPNIKELRNLMDYENFHPAIPSANLFLNVLPNDSWSSTSFAGDAESAWLVIMYDGRTNAFPKALSFFVWPVRSNNNPDITVNDSVAPVDDLKMPFGDVTEGNSSDQTLTVANDGNADLVIGTIAQVDPQTTPFSILDDLCSGQTLAPAENCILIVRFSPTTTGAFNDSFEIPSNDPDESTVTVNVSGEGLSSITNNPPSIPGLVFPADGQGGLGTTVTFRWKKSADPDGDPVTYDLCLREGDPNFIDTDCMAIEETASLMEKGIMSAGLVTYGSGLLVLGMVFAARMRTRRRIVMLFAMIITAEMLLVSCGGNGGAPSIPNDEVALTVSGLENSTTYHWKVVTDDGSGGTTESETRSFATQ